MNILKQLNEPGDQVELLLMTPRGSVTKKKAQEALLAARDPYKDVLEFYQQLAALHSRLTSKKAVNPVP
eukprot:6790069-Lingulodinium_polyedra.AAC.1